MSLPSAVLGACPFRSASFAKPAALLFRAVAHFFWRTPTSSAVLHSQCQRLCSFGLSRTPFGLAPSAVLHSQCKRPRSFGLSHSPFDLAPSAVLHPQSLGFALSGCRVLFLAHSHFFHSASFAMPWLCSFVLSRSPFGRAPSAVLHSQSLWLCSFVLSHYAPTSPLAGKSTSVFSCQWACWRALLVASKIVLHTILLLCAAFLSAML